ncbi:hypothetical protein FMN63_29105 [Stappia sp. BW2]|uniref:hypothetical protein n=1 Tax=Stappia sp. BW2 TaxID=2592622 RepID=UPI0011DEBECF|nr:hypothetical protein [Stappia sp. BW2]TYC63114.1 hypothetical protein FMN63_29105 [Stappia sp. BW2]
MTKHLSSVSKVIMVMGVLMAAPMSALADCSTDIDKVEAAVFKAQENGIAETTAEQMRALLDEANEEKKKGDEAKCQELINQAMQMGDIE